MTIDSIKRNIASDKSINTSNKNFVKLNYLGKHVPFQVNHRFSIRFPPSLDSKKERNENDKQFSSLIVNYLACRSIKQFENLKYSLV